MNDPHIWWYITRSSAVIGWVLMVLSVLWGILLSTRILRHTDNPGWLRDLHSYLSGATLAMVGVHLVSLMLDGWLKFSLTEVLVPFATDYRPLAVALGIIAFYLLAIVQITSLLMNRMPRRVWRAIHFASYGSLFFVAFHAGMAGTDISSTWYTMLSVVLIAVAALAVVLRILAGSREGQAAKAKQAAPEAHVVPVIETTRMVVAAASPIADRVLGLRLVPLGGGVLPPWRAGAHVTLHLPNGLERQYSLCGDPAERHHFDIAVLRTEDSAGGSEWIHANAVPGLVLEVSGPLNHFELEAASDYLFVAGGIGITPIRAMIESLPAQRNWHLVYVGRSRAHMPFLELLVAQFPGRVSVVPTDEYAERPDIVSWVRQSSAEVYCCGPEELMMAVADAVPAARMHFERFEPIERMAASAHSIDVTCSRSKKNFTVGPQESILSGMERNGVAVIGSCRKGVCGTCEVRVLGGEPEHLDSVMVDAEKDSIGVMYPCVSRAVGGELVLDA